MATTTATLRVGDRVISRRRTAVVTAVYPEDSTWGQMIAVRSTTTGREVSDWASHWSLVTSN